MPDWDSRNSPFPTLMGTIGYESRLKLLSDSIIGTGVDCEYGDIPYHSTTLDLRKRVLTTLIAFNGNGTGYGFWNDDHYQPVTNRGRLRVFFPAVLLASFLLAKYLCSLSVHTCHHCVGNCTSARVWYQISTKSRIPLSWSTRPTLMLLLVDPFGLTFCPIPDPSSERD